MRSCRTTRPAPAPRSPSPRSPARSRRRWAGRSSRRGSRTSWSGSTRSTRPKSIHVTENGSAWDDEVSRRRQRRRRGPGRLPRVARRGGRGRPSPRRAGRRLLRLVAARQLRVGLRLREAVRAGPGRLRHPGAHGQGERSPLRRDRRRPRCAGRGPRERLSASTPPPP